MAIEVGLVHEVTLTVQENETARVNGGESLPVVFSTPRMISHMERTAHYAVLPYLKEGQTSVGTLVSVRHLASTPPGAQVRVRVELIEVDRRRLRFKVEAWDEVDKIGEGEHERFIVDLERFNQRLESKRAQLNL
jgi:fluoroacetyl-CoA thioesterase